MKAKYLILPLALLCARSFSQSVGINTKTPHASSILDINSSNKGILIPRVALQSKSDNITIQSPANSLLVFKTGNLGGQEGFYYNQGDGNNASWKMLGTDFPLPFVETASNAGALLSLENTSQSSGSVAIQGVATERTGVWGSTTSGRGVTGSALGTGTGVYATSQSGLALEVVGKIKISGPGQVPGAGKVLMSDASGNATWQNPAPTIVAFSATGIDSPTAINSTGGASFVTVNFGSEVYDIGNNYNQQAHTFVAPTNGIYHFDTSIQWSQSEDDKFYPALQITRLRSGQTSVLAENEYTVIFKYTSTLSTDCQLQQGDVVFVQGKSALNNTKLETSTSTAHFNGRLIQKL